MFVDVGVVSSGRGQISLQARSKARYRCCMSDQVEVVGQANSSQVYKYLSCTLCKQGRVLGLLQAGRLV